MPKRNEYVKNDRLKREREARNWTQRRLAEMVGVSEKTVRAWESGERGISLPSKERLLSVFGLTAEELGFPAAEESVEEEQSRPGQMLALDVSLDLERVSRKMKRELGKSLAEVRQRLLSRVYTFWVQGILERSLYRETLILLGLQEQPDAVANPWRFAVQESELPAQLFPPGTSIVEMYDRADGLLLILGKPGAGKTTLLLLLAYELLKRATEDVTFRAPVIFNLSSWAEKRLAFDTWLAVELVDKYGIPAEFARQLIEEERILPLLDGLDEVDEAYTSACVTAINSYRKLHSLVPVVVCSRSGDYYGQDARLALYTSVEVQPLTQEQIMEYVLSGGESLASLRTTLSSDPVLLDLATTPLMLNIMAVIASDDEQRWKTLLSEGSLAERRRLVFRQYVERVLKRGTEGRYTEEETKEWLAWLAFEMQKRSQVEFYIERMQPDLLPSTRLRQGYYTFMVLTLNAFGNTLVCGLFGLLRGANSVNQDGLTHGLIGWLGARPGSNVLGWMGAGFGGGIRGGGAIGLIFSIVAVLVSVLVRLTSYRITLNWREIWKSQVRGLLLGVLAALIIALLSSFVLIVSGKPLLAGVYNGLGYGLIGGMNIGILNGFIATLRLSNETLEVKNSRRRGLRTRLIDAGVAGFSAAVGYGLVNTFIAGTSEVITQSFALALCVGLLYGLDGRMMNSLGYGLGVQIRPAEIVRWSWQNVREHLVEDSVRAFLIGLYMMGAVSLIFGLASALLKQDLQYGVAYGFVFGLIVGVIVGAASLLTSLLNRGWSSTMVDEHQFGKPNEGIKRSLRNSLYAALVVGVLGGVLSGLISGFAFGVVGGIPGWYFLALAFMLAFSVMFIQLFGLAFGGVAVFAHLWLRFLLWRRRSIAWDYVDFLDYASERILLRKKGGGYMFIHRQLLDYFADLSPEKQERS